MESNTFTRTSFCGKECDNITDNDTKKFILQDMKIKCDRDYSTPYARLFNIMWAKNLNNPHVVCVKTTGAPYFMFCTRINDIGYTFLIDKKIKEGYDYPKIFVLPYRFNRDIYNGTLLETELIRDRNQHWCLLIGDVYQYCGKSQKKYDICKRVNTIYTMLNENYTDDSYTDLCPMTVKGYFEYKDLPDLKENLIPKLSYNVRGLYYVPMNSHHKCVLQLFDRKPRDVNKPHDVNKTTQRPHKKEFKKEEKSKGVVADADTDVSVAFQFVKTLKPDIYDLYIKDGDDKVKIGIPNIPNMRISKLVRNNMKKNEMGCFMECSMIDSKWVPQKIADKIDTYVRYNRVIKNV